MRDRSFLPLLDGKTKNRNTLYRTKTLESIPEHAGEDIEDNIPWPKAHGSFDANEQGKETIAISTDLNPAVNLPKLEKKSNTNRVGTPSKLDHRTIHSPKSSSFLSIANMPLSPREKAAEKSKRENEIKSANYLIYEPTIAEHVTTEIELSRYAFRATLDRIPETDGERLLSAHSKRKSNSGDKKRRNSGTTERNSEGEKNTAIVSQLMSGNKKQMASLRSVDLFAQQRQEFARNGPPTRVAFSYKMIQGHADSVSFMEQGHQGLHDSPAKSLQLNAEDVVFPRIVLYQWEVHEQPKLIKAFRPRRPKKRLHRIPTGQVPQDHQTDDGNDDMDDMTIRPDSSVFKLPQPPPPTPKCDSCKELSLIKSGSPEH